MAKFIAVAALLVTLTCSSMALPHHHEKEAVVDSAPLTLLPPTGAEAGESKFFFFPFNFWNGFRPLPWIPLPGIQLPTTAAPPPPAGNEDGDAGGDDDEGEDEDGGDDVEDEGGDDEEDEGGDDAEDEGGDDDEAEDAEEE